MNSFLKIIIIHLIQLIEKWEYRNEVLNQDDVSKKIMETFKLDGYETLTDSGWQPISHIHKTQPFKKWKIKTNSGKFLEGADNHILFNENMEEVFIKDLKIGDSIQTKDGIEKINEVIKDKVSVSMFDTTINSKDHRYYTNDILSHNTVTSSIFIAWYLCFHYERNVMVVANKLATTNEIVDKIKIILKNLPFFMKPGVLSGGVTGMRFDNGNRLFSQATTKTAAIGFTIHLLFADEFAHIHPNFLLPFYRSIYPTLSSSQISRIIICSTPNGMNLFYEIYQAATEGKNAYNAIRVDWWQVPGRDEEWKRREIANLGSEELFNQEYGNQFLASSRLLLSSKMLEFLKRTTQKYVMKEMDDFLDYPELIEAIKWHPKYDPNRREVKNEKIVFAVDIGDGVGRDYSVINIFRLETKSPVMIRKTKDWSDETAFFRLKQIGLFRSNVLSVEEMSKALEILVFNVYNHENCKIVMEINFKGNLVFERMSRNAEFYPEIFLYTKHSINNDQLKLGVKIQKDNKESYSRELRNLINNRRVVINEMTTFMELSSFGINSQGRYEAQLGNDDTAMSCVNLVTYFESNDFYEMVEDLYDYSSSEVKAAVEKRMSIGDKGNDDMMDMFKLIGGMGNNGGFKPTNKPATNNTSGYSSNNNMFKM